MEEEGMDARALLERMVGDWDLRGEMGDVPLHQSVEARWVLGETFVSMYCASLLPPSDVQKRYEALYHIGYNGEHDLFVMHLLDTFGVSVHPVPGIGNREGDSIPFVFQYEPGPFTNTFSWDETAGTWTHHLVSHAGGTPETFATKHLTRR
jgi:hypothetical protein